MSVLACASAYFAPWGRGALSRAWDAEDGALPAAVAAPRLGSRGWDDSSSEASEGDGSRAPVGDGDSEHPSDSDSELEGGGNCDRPL